MCMDLTLIWQIEWTNMLCQLPTTTYLGSLYDFFICKLDAKGVMWCGAPESTNHAWDLRSWGIWNCSWCAKQIFAWADVDVWDCWVTGVLPNSFGVRP